MNTNKLRTLAAYLRTVPPEKFDMGVWSRETYCGTTACAVGHACDIEEFKAEGLHLGRPYNNSEYAVPNFAGLQSFRAVDAFFDLWADQSSYLFGTRTHRETPREVANRIEVFVATDGEIPEA